MGNRPTALILIENNISWSLRCITILDCKSNWIATINKELTNSASWTWLKSSWDSATQIKLSWKSGCSIHLEYYWLSQSCSWNRSRKLCVQCSLYCACSNRWNQWARRKWARCTWKVEILWQGYWWLTKEILTRWDLSTKILECIERRWSACSCIWITSSSTSWWNTCSNCKWKITTVYGYSTISGAFKFQGLC